MLRSGRITSNDGKRFQAVSERTAAGSETREAGLLAIARDALLHTDRDGRIHFANPAAASLLNTTPAKLRTRLLVTLVEPAHRRSFRSCLSRAGMGEPVTFSMRLAPAGARPTWVVAHAETLDGGLGWVLTESSEPEEAASSDPVPLERVQLGRILEAVRDGVVVVDRDRCVLFANSVARAMFAPQEVAIGEPVPDLWTASVRALVDELFDHDAFNAEAVVEPEPRIAYWLRAYRSGAGDVVLLLSDVTAEERREQAERDFVAHAAHELQSPLAGIAGAVEVLLGGGAEDPEARERFLAHIDRESKRLTRVVRSLLVLAQAQAADVAVTTEAFELRPLLEQVVRDEPAGVRVELACSPALRVEAHHDLLEHALRNLVSNAIRHSPGKRVIVGARDAEAGRVAVEVTDFGPGIPPEDRERIFERFYRGAGTASGEGVGLGLSIAQQVARAVGGDLELGPNPDGGTVATLRLRRAA